MRNPIGPQLAPPDSRRAGLRRWFAALGALALGFSSAPAARGSWAQGAEGDEQTTTATEADAHPTRIARLERFDFHSDPWVNLHHFLYQWARSESGPRARDTRPVLRVVEKEALPDLEREERAIWNAAWQHYRDECIQHSLTFTREASRAKAGLLGLATAGEQERYEQLDALGELGAVLLEAMPIYRAHWWEQHDRQNRTCAASVRPLWLRFRGQLTKGLARAYAGRWAEQALRVDYTYYANWAGGYTTNRPNHICVASSDTDTCGPSGLELLVHEASHTIPLQGDHQVAVEAAFRAREREAPARFWHALIFYTAGELTTRALHGAELGPYLTYAKRRGFYASEGWSGYGEAFDAHWRPFLVGEVDRATALEGIVEALER